MCDLHEQAERWLKQLSERVDVFGFLGGAAEAPRFRDLLDAAVQAYTNAFGTEIRNRRVARVYLERAFIVLLNDDLGRVWPDGEEPKGFAANVNEVIGESMTPAESMDDHEQAFCIVDVRGWLMGLEKAGALQELGEGLTAPRRTVILILATAVAAFDNRLKTEGNSIEACLELLMPMNAGRG